MSGSEDDWETVSRRLLRSYTLATCSKAAKAWIMAMQNGEHGAESSLIPFKAILSTIARLSLPPSHRRLHIFPGIRQYSY